MNKLYLLILSISIVVFTGCGPSERELELEKKLQQVIEMQEASSKQLQASQDALQSSKDALVKSEDELRVLMQAEQQRLDEQKKQLKLNGSVFVVTKGGTNYKLGLTPIAALTKEEFERVESLSIEMVNKFIVENSPAYQKAKAEFLSVKEKLDLLKKQYYTVRAARKSLIDSYDYGQANYNSSISIYEGLGEVIAYRDHALARSIHERLNSEASKMNTIVGKYQGIRNQINDDAKLMDTIARQANNRILTYQRSLATLALEVAQTKTKTNADGEFSLNMSRGMDFVLIAFADRSVGDSTEDYNWFIPYATPLVQGEDTLLISNDTMASDTSPATSSLKDFKSSPYLTTLEPQRSYSLDCKN